MRLLVRLVIVATLVLSVPSCVKKSSNFGLNRCHHAEQDLFCLQSRNIELGSESLSLDRIIQIALSRNLDLLVKAQEIKIQSELTLHQALNTLPSLVTSYDNWGRDNNTASFSESLVPGVPPAPLSISSETHIELSHLEFTWNLIDFGVSYYKSRQELNATLIEEMHYARIKQNLILEITRQYWKAALAKMVMESTEDLYAESRQLRQRIETLMDNGELSNYIGLKIINDLLENEVLLSSYPKDYQSAKSELLKLMGVLPDQDFDIVVGDINNIIELTKDVQYLERLALANRPELFSSDLEQKKMQDEVRISFLRMFPNVEFFEGTFTDENRFLLYNSWKRAGLRATWDLLRLPARITEKSVSKRKLELVEKNRLNLSFSVIAQVNLAYYLIYDLQEQHGIAQEWFDANQKLMMSSRKLYEHGEINLAEMIDNEFQVILAKIAWYKTGAELQVAIEQLNNAIGIPQHLTMRVEN